MQQIVQRLFQGVGRVTSGFGNLKDLQTLVLEIRICAFEKMYLFL